MDLPWVEDGEANLEKYICQVQYTWFRDTRNLDVVDIMRITMTVVCNVVHCKPRLF